MIKHSILATAALFAAPALAQTAQPQQGVAATPATGQTITPATPATTVATDPNIAATSTPAAGQGATATAQPAASAGAQVASLVDSQFPTYDKNGDGKLSKAEFADWITALKQQSDPSAKPDAKYDAAAFSQADKNKNQSISKTELEGFLGGKS